MSEPSSLYMHITLSEAALHAFRASAPTLPRQYADWLPWLAAQSYYGSITEDEIQAMALYAHPSKGAPQTVEEYLFPVGVPSWGQLSHYNPVLRRWTFGLIECSENYRDFIEILGVLRAAAHYKDLPAEDVILIYPYLWGGRHQAYLTLEEGRSRFVADLPETVRYEADAVFDGFRRSALGADDV